MKVTVETNRKKLAILFFSRNVVTEIQYKRWMPKLSKLKNRLLGSQLIKQSNDVLLASNLPIYHSHEGNQKGRTFGERLSNAFQEVYSKGYDAVIAVGNDCPELNLVDWTDIETKLCNGQCVFGPTQLGGIYLIALTKEVFLKEGFENLPWQSSGTFQALCEFYKEKTACYVLPSRIELNSYSDLHKALKSTNVSKNLKNLLYHLLAIVNKIIYVYKSLLYTTSLFIRSESRAPPALI